MNPQFYFKDMKSPVGTLMLVASDKGLAAILWEKNNPERKWMEVLFEDKKHPVLIQAENQLKEYFSGKRKKFELKLDWHGTDFQKKVWKALLSIPYGKTASYADIAKKVGTPKAVRAVGSANAKNPVCIIAPCHRVITSSGALGGYSGGLENKKLLLDLEKTQ
jgi:methylated-DNA-[protein]-cysteine S-methyltransferase